MSTADKVVDYLLTEGDNDKCGHCVNYIPWTDEDERRVGSDNLITCKAFDKPRGCPPVCVCREGIKAYFEAQK